MFNHIARRSHPEWIRLTVDGKLDLLLTVRTVVLAHDLLDDVPVARTRLVKPLVHKLVGHPGYLRFDSTFELTVTLDGVTETRTGTTLHELVALN